MDEDINYIQPINPNYEERHKMLRISLEKENRIEDLNNIIELLGPPQDITTINSEGSGKKFKVCIIGGGVAGLSSAFELRKLGYNITIFDMEKDRIGGRVYTYYFDKSKNYYGELGAMRIPVSHETTWHYIDLFKLKSKPFIQDNKNGFVFVRGKRARNNNKSIMEIIYPEFKLSEIERKLSIESLIKRTLGSQIYKIDSQKRKEILQIKKEYSKEIQYFDSLSIRNVLEISGLTQEAIELISCVNTFLGYFYYNSYIENLQEQYTIDNYYRYEIEGGFVKLPIAFYNSLESKNPKEYVNIENKNIGRVNFKKGKEVFRMSLNNIDDKIKIYYRDVNSLKNHCETFDYVICTIPFSSLRNVDITPMFSSEKMQAIKELNYVNSQKTVYMCSDNFWQYQKIVGGASYTDLPISTVWYSNEMYNKGENRKTVFNKRKDVLMASYNLNQDSTRLGSLDDQVRNIEIKRQLEAVHGLPYKYLDSIIEKYKTVQWNTEKGFYGGFCYFMPGQMKNFAYASIKPEFNNKIYFAGEHVSSTHGWIQGSLNSAMKAANDIVIHCKNNIKISNNN